MNAVDRVIEVNFGNNFVKSEKSAPGASGIYAICRGRKENDKWKISELLYIGESANIKRRLGLTHEKLQSCSNLARINHEELMFFFALIPNHDNRELAERALIWEMTPRFNERIDFPEANHVVIKTTSVLGIPSVIRLYN